MRSTRSAYWQLIDYDAEPEVPGFQTGSAGQAGAEEEEEEQQQEQRQEKEQEEEGRMSGVGRSGPGPRRPRGCQKGPGGPRPLAHACTALTASISS